METYQQFVHSILQPYRERVAQRLSLEKDAKMIWLLNCWSVHKSQEFVAWIKEKHPQILLIFVPANCTSVYQPVDVIFQRPFKHGFRQEFDDYTTNSIDKQLEEKESQDVKLDFKMSTFKSLLCGWLLKAWQHVNQPAMILRGWSQCDLQQVFNKTFQTTAMEEHIKNPFFKETLFGIEVE